MTFEELKLNADLSPQQAHADALQTREELGMQLENLEAQLADLKLRKEGATQSGGQMKRRGQSQVLVFINGFVKTEFFLFSFSTKAGLADSRAGPLLLLLTATSLPSVIISSSTATVFVPSSFSSTSPVLLVDFLVLTVRDAGTRLLANSPVRPFDLTTACVLTFSWSSATPRAHRCRRFGFLLPRPESGRSCAHRQGCRLVCCLPLFLSAAP